MNSLQSSMLLHLTRSSLGSIELIQRFSTSEKMISRDLRVIFNAETDPLAFANYKTIKRGRGMRDDVPIDTPLHFFSETTRHTYRHWHK